MEIRIEPVTEARVESFHRCFDTVARERRWLAFTAAPPLEAFRGFVQGVIASGATRDRAAPGDARGGGFVAARGAGPPRAVDRRPPA